MSPRRVIGVAAQETMATEREQIVVAYVCKARRDLRVGARLLVLV